MDKSSLRKIIMEKRHNNNEKDLLDKFIFDKLKVILEKYNNIGSYYSFDDEVDTYRINNWILDNNKKLYLPKITNKKIEFYNLENLDDVHIGDFKVKEPNSNVIFDVNNLDCIIVPMLAFNKDNYRLGFGKAYYDGVLKDYKGYKLGIAYGFQKTDELMVEGHDIALDIIITE